MTTAEEEASTPAPVEVAAADATTTAEETTTTGDDNNTYGYAHLDDLDLPPFRIHATKGGGRFSASNLQIPGTASGSGLILNHQQQPKRFSLDSSSKARSRSRSPSWRTKDRTVPTMALTDGNSSLSSLEEFVDPDILYDKSAFCELEAKNSKSSQDKSYHQNSHSYTFGETPTISRPINLTPVSERMSEDTLEDVHAFSDLSANTNTRPSSSVGTGGSTVGGEVSSHVLEPLDEGDEDDLDSEDEHHHEKLNEDAAHQPQAQPQVILTNLENITLQDQQYDNDEMMMIHQSHSNSHAGVPTGTTATAEDGGAADAPPAEEGGA